ncbi:heme exporter protein CcmD [Alteromonas oceanisediminis]|uniref:heme exporter protein CcmD n=1 Tax=Alteromonas oceanisediminis TaxID=2836180 RepID=UPI001BDA403B|nr:heme exporter protein CcmD [Alteromonas oceanisediminis]
MRFDSFSEFVAMGGYGFFVWLSFGVTFVVMLLLVVDSFYGQRRVLQKAKQEIERKQRILAARRAAAKESQA